MTELIFKDSKYDYAILCKTCGHIEEMHRDHHHDCLEQGCECEEFKIKSDEQGNVIYDPEEVKE